MDSHALDITRPHEKQSPAKKLPYSTPTLRIIGTMAECKEAATSGLNIGDVGPPADPDALLRAYRLAVEREALAWRAVAMQLPGEPGFDKKAWDTWQRASLAERQARLEWEETVSASNQSNFAELWRYIR
jgi:hypothetical protein